VVAQRMSRRGIYVRQTVVQAPRRVLREVEHGARGPTTTTFPSARSVSTVLAQGRRLPISLPIRVQPPGSGYALIRKNHPSQLPIIRNNCAQFGLYYKLSENTRFPMSPIICANYRWIITIIPKYRANIFD
jgi:hypothetical protein